MRRILIITFGLIISLAANSQNWAPTGATWHYTEQFSFSGDLDFLRIEALTDTVVLGKNCKVLTERHKLGCSNRPVLAITYSENDTVYFYDPFIGGFQILYDFNAIAGDVWSILLPDNNDTTDTDTLKITVDSTDMTSINGVPLKRYYVTYEFIAETSPGSYAGTIVQRIGDLHYMFNFPTNDQMACDLNYSGGIRCYEDSVVGLYTFGQPVGCEFQYVGINELKSGIQLSLFPNPTDGLVKMATSTDADIEYCSIRNSLGQVIFEKKWHGAETVDFSGLAQGLYIVELYNNHHHRIAWSKLVKN